MEKYQWHWIRNLYKWPVLLRRGIQKSEGKVRRRIYRLDIFDVNSEIRYLKMIAIIFFREAINRSEKDESKSWHFLIITKYLICTWLQIFFSIKIWGHKGKEPQELFKQYAIIWDDFISPWKISKHFLKDRKQYLTSSQDDSISQKSYF